MSVNAEAETPDQQEAEELNIDPPVAADLDAKDEDLNELNENISLDVEAQNPLLLYSTKPSSPAHIVSSTEELEETEHLDEALKDKENSPSEYLSCTVQLTEQLEQSLEEPTQELGEVHCDLDAEVTVEVVEAHRDEAATDIGTGDEGMDEEAIRVRTEDVEDTTELQGATGSVQTGGREEEESESVEPCSPRTTCIMKRKAMKRRPCSLPVSELETVIASSCTEPETPRSHYIRIHHLLHSLPSAQPSSYSQDDGDTIDSSEDVSLKPVEYEKEVADETEEGSSETRSPSIVPECLGPCCRRILPPSLSIERLSELNHLLEGETRSRLESVDGETESGGQRVHRESECELCDNSCYSTSCYSTSCYSTSCYSNSGHEGRNRICSHTRLSSVDSTRLSESTVFSSQEEEEENSAFESVTDSGQSPESRELGDISSQWMEDQIEGGHSQSPVAGPSVGSPGEEEM